MRNFALPLGVSVEKRVHDDGAARVGKHFAAQADESAAGNLEFHTNAPVAMVVHLLHLGLAHAELFHDHTDELFGDVDGEVLNWLHQLAIDSLGDDLGLSYGELVTFAAHHLYKDGKLEFASAKDFEGVRGVPFLHF